MIINTKFPALISSANVPRFDSPKSVFGLWDTSVEIQEISADEVPVVLQVTDHSDHLGERIHDFRYRDGVFYKSLDIDLNFKKGHKEYAFFDYREIWKTFVLQAKLADRPDEVYPKGVVRQLLDLRDVSFHYDKLKRIGVVCRPLDTGKGELEAARSKFLEHMSSIILINGAAWIKCGEPMLSVDHFAPYCADVVTYDLTARDELTGKYRSIPFGRFLYTMHQQDRAFVPKRHSSGFVDRTKVKLIDPSVFSTEVPLGYIVSVLEQVLENVRYLPEDVSGRLSSFVRDEQSWNWDAAYDEIECLLKHVRNMSGQFAHDLLEVELERINARSIDIDAGFRPAQSLKPITL